MMGDTKIKKAIIATLLTILMATTAYAAYYVYSNVVHVKITDYSLHLEVANNGLEVTFTATLIDPSNQPVSGKTVEFGYYDANRNFQYLCQNTTDTNGVATYTTKVTAGDYDFVARASVP
jgi:ABC-type uncharacterized transport system substrate-binding protein